MTRHLTLNLKYIHRQVLCEGLDVTRLKITKHLSILNIQSGKIYLTKVTQYGVHQGQLHAVLKLESFV